jgi:invasion protein IalB
MAQVGNQRSVTRERSWTSWMNGRNALRAVLVLALLFAGGVLALIGERLMGAGAGGANETRVATFQDWRVICPPYTPATPNCALTLDVLRDTGGILMTVSMLDPAPNSALSLTVPHGVLLDSGIGFSIGTEPMRVRPYETCNNAGCIALVTVDADTLKALSGNMQGQVVVAVPGNAMPVTIPFSLRGFGDGFAELRRAKARRTSYLGFLGL